MVEGLFLSGTLAVAACGSASGSKLDDDPGATAGAANGNAGKGGTSSGGASSGGASSGGEGGTASEGGSAGASSGGEGGASPAGGSAGSSTAGSAGAGGSSQGCTAGTILCDGNTKKVCDGNGGYSETVACPGVCTDTIGCTVCSPGVGTCDGTNAKVCKGDGSGETVTMCDPKLGCAGGQCVSACTGTDGKRSYIGCDYFPTVTSNHNLFAGFSFAVVVANTTTMDANVTITRGSMSITSGAVKAGQVGTFKLPWVDELRHNLLSFLLPSAQVASGAYHLKTDQPVTVYQFNPLEYEIPKVPACLDSNLTGKCFSYTNDASLLLPVSALGTEYIVASSPSAAAKTDTGTVGDIPGLVAITATENGTSVTVVSSAHVRAGNGFGKLSPGQSQVFKLNAGDVVQLLTATPTDGDVSGCTPKMGGGEYCKATAAYDLTGTKITSDKPIAVIGGHDCAFAPFDKPACDHLEETNFPLSTWGKSAIVSAPQSVTGSPTNSGVADGQLIRVISGADGNVITLDPPIPGANVGTLAKGQWVDLPQTNLDVMITGTGPLLVTQTMLGADIVDPGASQSRGDPSLSLAVSTAQYRSDYVFLAPATYISSFVNVIAPVGAVITLDGAPLTGPAPKAVGNSGYTVMRKAISGASHTLKGDKPFGAVVYGYGSYTSYMYPAGLNLEAL